MIDWGQVKELENGIGAEDFAEIVDVFIAEVDEAIDALRGSELAGEELSSAMHFLKGSAANLGFSDLAAYCSEGEKKAQNGSSTEVDLTHVISLYENSKANFIENAPSHLSYNP